jgi:hypothetical protein
VKALFSLESAPPSLFPASLYFPEFAFEPCPPRAVGHVGHPLAKFVRPMKARALGRVQAEGFRAGDRQRQPRKRTEPNSTMSDKSDKTIMGNTARFGGTMDKRSLEQVARRRLRRKIDEQSFTR